MKYKTIREAAHSYIKLGFSIIPVGSDKKPLLASWKRYQTEHTTHQDAEAWLKQWPDMNIGIVTGAISGIVVVDIEAGGTTDGFPPTIATRTGGLGFHLFYKHPGYPVKNGVRIAPLTDIRGDGGYVVAPPSVSTKGPYDWLITPQDDDMAEYPAKLLESLHKDSEPKNEAPQGTGVVPVGQRNDAATRFAGSVLAALPRKLWDTAGWGALKEWNGTQTAEPLSEQELRSVFESIGAREISVRGEEPKEVSLSTFTLSNLLDEVLPEARWAVEGLIPLNGITILTGVANSYKSFLTQDLALSVANGEQFLGKFPTTPGKVLIIDEENSRWSIQDRFKCLGAGKMENLLFVHQAGLRLDKEEHVGPLMDLIEREEPMLIILDSFVRFHRGDENASRDMSWVFATIKKLVGGERAVLVIHHHRKNYFGQGEGTSSQSIRGSSDIIAAVDSHLAVDRRGSEVKVTQTKLRIREEMKPFKIALAPADATTMRFAYVGEDDTLEQELSKAVDKVIEYMFESDGEQTVKSIAEETKLAQSRVRSALKTLADGEQVSFRVGEHNTRFYSLGTPKENVEPSVEPVEDTNPETEPIF
jgi:DNA-binding transcriptional ArsR family regulator